MGKFLNKKGLTMLELIIVIAIIAIITTIVMIAPSRLMENTKLSTDTDQIVQTLRLAYTRATTQYENSSWGVYFYEDPANIADKFILFKGTSYATRDASFDIETTMQKNVAYSTITLTGGAKEVVFAKSTGVTAQTGTVNIVTDSKTNILTINSKGMVSINESISSGPVLDSTAPSAIINLVANGPTTTTINLTWTAPGNDGNVGTAASYDIRYSTSTITAGNWATATQVSGEPLPQVAGTVENMTVTGLTSNTQYFFAIKTQDAVPNISGLSNIATSTTLFADIIKPAAITDLATSAPGVTQVTLTWTAPGDDTNTGTATTYDIRYSTSPITEGTWATATQVTGEPAPLVAGTVQTMNVTGLTPSTLYYFAIKTLDEVPNTSAISNVPTATTLAPDTTAPSAVANLATSSPTLTTITLTWNAPGDDANVGTATTYDIRYSTSLITVGNWGSATQVVGEPAPQIAGSAKTMTITGLTPNTTYYFALKTSDEVPNTSLMSNVASGTTLSPDSTAPSAIIDLATSSPTATTMNLTWTSPGDDAGVGTATSYDIRYSTSAITAGNWASATPVSGIIPAPLLAGTVQSMTVTGLTQSTTYYFAMKTSDEVPNISALSNVPTGTTLTPDIIAPATISNLATSSPTDTTMVLSWTAPGDDNNIGTATSYDIRYSTSAITAGNFASATPVSGTVPAPAIAGAPQSMTVTGLSPTTLYYFAMKTSDEVPNVSAMSNVATGTTTAIPDTTPPATISNLAIASYTATTVNITWTSPGDDANVGTATTYDIRYSTSVITAGNWASATQVTGEPAPLVAGTAQSMTVTGLSGTTTYYFAMKTSDEVPNTSGLSNVVNTTTSGLWMIPTLAGSLDLSGTHDGIKIQVLGNYAYVVRGTGTPNFQIINISNPAAPTVTASLNLTGSANDLYVLGNYAYVASGDSAGELKIINISNPAAPVLTGTYNAPGTSAAGQGVFVVSTKAYLVRATSADKELYVVNVTTPASPTLIGSLELAATAYDVVVSGNYAFIASANNAQELQVANIVPTTPTLATSLDLATNNDATNIAISGTNLYIGQTSELRVVSIATPLSPTQIGTLTPIGTITDIALNFDASPVLLFITIRTTVDTEMKAINIATPASPSIWGVGYQYSGDLMGIAYSPAQDRCYAVGTDNALEFISLQPE